MRIGGAFVILAISLAEPVFRGACQTGRSLWWLTKSQLRSNHILPCEFRQHISRAAPCTEDAEPIAAVDHLYGGLSANRWVRGAAHHGRIQEFA